VAGKLSSNLPWTLANPLWSSQLNPVISDVETLKAVPLNGGTLLTKIVLIATTPKAIAHGLGRVPTGWTLTDNIANAVIWRTAWTAQTITLESTANTTISVWVF
jgi:hypothetical protein